MCTMQWLLLYSQSWASISTIYSTLSSPQEVPIIVTVQSPLPPAPNQLFTSADFILTFQLNGIRGLLSLASFI
jgi:hypothetical protein